MATIAVRESDLSGVRLDPETPFVKIALTVDGDIEQYEIDITTDELDELRKVLAPYFTAGRFTPGKETVKASSAADSERNDVVRKWAQEIGPKYISMVDSKELGPVKDRGRIPTRVYQAYDAYLKNSDVVDAEDAAKAAKAEDEAKAQTDNGNGPQDVVAPEFKAPAKGRK